MNPVFDEILWLLECRFKRLPTKIDGARRVVSKSDAYLEQHVFEKLAKKSIRLVEFLYYWCLIGNSFKERRWAIIWPYTLSVGRILNSQFLNPLSRELATLAIHHHSIFESPPTEQDRRKNINETSFSTCHLVRTCISKSWKSVCGTNVFKKYLKLPLLNGDGAEIFPIKMANRISIQFSYCSSVTSKLGRSFIWWVLGIGKKVGFGGDDLTGKWGFQPSRKRASNEDLFRCKSCVPMVNEPLLKGTPQDNLQSHR